MQKAFKTGGTAGRNARGWGWMWNVPEAGNREGWRRVRKQEKLERRLEREADSGHTGPGRSLGWIPTAHGAWSVMSGSTKW